ncbi:hypothetical protein RchiOBHm_Chr1g0322201 [Rosa chinensis]|uniref:Uncharacterized protein n=1 Tax=Rosa chinensis TaxID=74649 RepID=A0A2P6S970_ROSCH|nr:hypothetical protein RchiOBHm_Chr1g0322201 [Rosa chinensis]
MMADDSGGLSANKAAGQEEEGSTAPFPEKDAADGIGDDFSFDTRLGGGGGGGRIMKQTLSIRIG